MYLFPHSILKRVLFSPPHTRTHRLNVGERLAEESAEVEQESEGAESENNNNKWKKKPIDVSLR